MLRGRKSERERVEERERERVRDREIKKEKNNKWRKLERIQTDGERSRWSVSHL